METKKVKIHDLARAGSGVAKLETGEVLFVPFSAPQDELEVEITESKKNYSQAKIVQILNPSPLRETPRCSVFEKCGGCSWQHLPYDLQFETKKKGLLHALKRAGVDLSSIPLDEFKAKSPYGYRNRIQLRGNPNQKHYGFFEKGSKSLVAIETCPIASDAINTSIPSIMKTGFERFKEEFKVEIEVLESGKVRSSWNESNAAFGFRQINDEQNICLQNWVSAHTKPADLLFDLFGGHGNLSLSLANQFKEVFCMDLSVPKMDPPGTPENFHFEEQSIVKWARTPHPKSHLNQSASFILDPPREGLGALFPQIESKISKMKVESVVLVGCDVDSFTKDVSGFIKKGYRLARLGVLDLFPQTPHVESLALFYK